jgi:hypothetical protein
LVTTFGEQLFVAETEGDTQQGQRTIVESMLSSIEPQGGAIVFQVLRVE